MAYKFNPFTGNLDLVETGGGGTPGGSDTQVQFNDGGAFGGDSGLTFDKTTNALTVGASTGDGGSAQIFGDITLDDGGVNTTTLQMITPTTDRTISFPDASGTVALVAGSSGQVTYNSSGVQAGDSGLTYDDAAGALTVGGKTVTTDAPIINLSQTWNNAATTFTGLKLNVTNTASAAGSNLLDLQVGGVSAVQVRDNEIKYSGSRVALYTGTGGGGSVDIAGVGSLDTVPLRVEYSLITIANRAKVGFTTGTNINTGVDVALSRDSAGVVKVTNGSSGTGYIKQVPVAVSALPLPATVGAGTRGFVNDANDTTFASVVAQGGSNVVPVYCDGTSWRIG